MVPLILTSCMAVIIGLFTILAVHCWHMHGNLEYDSLLLISDYWSYISALPRRRLCDQCGLSVMYSVCLSVCLCATLLL